MSAAGRTAGRSAIVRTPGRGRRAIRVTRHRTAPGAPRPPCRSSPPRAARPMRPPGPSRPAASVRQWPARCPSMCSGEPALRRQDDHQDPLRDGDVVDSGRVAQDHPRGDAPDHPIDPGGERLDHPKTLDVLGVRDGPVGIVGGDEDVARAGDLGDLTVRRERVDRRDRGEPVALRGRRSFGDPDVGSHAPMMSHAGRVRDRPMARPARGMAARPTGSTPRGTKPLPGDHVPDERDEIVGKDGTGLFDPRSGTRPSGRGTTWGHSRRWPSHRGSTPRCSRGMPADPRRRHPEAAAARSPWSRTDCTPRGRPEPPRARLRPCDSLAVLRPLIVGPWDLREFRPRVPLVDDE